MHRLFLSMVFIGIFHSGLSLADEVPAIDELPSPGKVIVEPSYVNEQKTDGDYELFPYEQRRSKWGVTFALDYNSFEPVNYEPNFVALDYASVYDAPTVPNVGFDLVVKRNFSLGSLGAELGFSMFKADAYEDLTKSITDSSLSLYLIELGLQYNMDTLFSRSPYVVPYASGGLYTIMYRETNASTSFNGNTMVAPYVKAGLAFQLDWLDSNSARSGYASNGLENSYLFAEVRSLFETQDDSDPDFTTETPTWGAGVKVEF